MCRRLGMVLVALFVAMQVYSVLPEIPGPTGILSLLFYLYFALPLAVGIVVGRFWVVGLYAVTPILALVSSAFADGVPSADDVAVIFFGFFLYLGAPLLLGVFLHLAAVSAREHPRGSATA